ncbi:hypothetical protein GIB67_037375, partial [Kingdonia uniflora]
GHFQRYCLTVISYRDFDRIDCVYLLPSRKGKYTTVGAHFIRRKILSFILSIVGNCSSKQRANIFTRVAGPTLQQLKFVKLFG